MTGDLDAAARVGRDLVATAIRHGDRCTWIGPVVDPARPGAALARPVGPALYDGCAGIGLVLAELAACTGDGAFRDTAAAALRAASDAADGTGLGLHTGSPGVALALVRGGALIRDEALVAAGRRLAAGCDAVPHGPCQDVIGGRAGGVLALLAIGDPVSVATAERLADAMVAEVRRRGAWEWPADRESLLPTGVSHGATGVAHALYEVAAATGRGDLAAAAGEAVRAERGHFDPVAGNWPRATAEDNARDHGGSEVSQVHWCHGAPGVAQMRHRVWRRTGDEALRAEAALALATTARWTRGALAAGRGAWCLCHGLPGNAEILWECADAAGPDEAAGHVALAREVADAGIAEHVEGGLPWPGGLAGGDPGPGLMIGLAGVARFLLRLARPDLPSLLLPGGLGWATVAGQSSPNSVLSASVSSRVVRSAARSSAASSDPQVVQG
ncbi:MAG: lanthionine synthetase LanC family protein [Thermoleophilia bacterium]